MTNQLKESLGKISEVQIISNIERIIASYRHVWDIYTELIQNSADAIIEQFGFNNMEKGKIILEIFPDERKLIISDNGTGIEERDLSKILAIGESIKRRENRGKYGFMGFGLTFVAFQSEYIRIESIKDGYYASRTYKDLYKFVYLEEELPTSDEERDGVSRVNTDKANGTVITVKFPFNFPEEAIEKNLKLAFTYAQNEGLIEYILRTRTAVGLLDPLFGNNKNFEFILKINNKELNIPNFFLTTRDIIKKMFPLERRLYRIDQDYKKIIDLTEHMPENQKTSTRRAILLDEFIDNIQIGTINPLNARLYLSSTSKDNLNVYAQKLDLENDKYSDMKIENGLWLAINGLPTGICLDKFDHSTYLPFSGIIDIQNNKMRNELDAGRKGITKYRANQIAEKVRELLREYKFIEYRSYVVGTDSRISNPLYDPKDELKAKLRSKTEFDIDLNHKYFPPIEEQEVISIFTELISKNIIKGYSEKVLSGYEVYDGLYHYKLESSTSNIFSYNNIFGIKQSIFDRNSGILEKNDVLIEFKVDLNFIYKDISNNRKDISQIDILVCWSVNYDDRERYLTNYGDILEEKNIETNVYYGVTHQLITSKRQLPLPIIELRTIINKIYNLNFII